MCFNSVAAATAYLLAIVVLDSTVLALSISNLHTTRTNADPLSLLGYVVSLVDTLGATQTHKAVEPSRESGSALSDRCWSELRTH